MNHAWERITALFDAARVLAPADRTLFLESACGSDQELRTEIESLLAQDASGDHFLSEPAAPEWAQALWQAASAADADPELVLNRYRIQGPLGSGGQAVVYRAIDEKLSRPVVVKVLRPQGFRNEW